MAKKDRAGARAAGKRCCRSKKGTKCRCGRFVLALGAVAALVALAYWLGHPGTEEEHGTIS
ncbi:hypothetical protein [Propionibacterium cyclohexanicum]|nr:hypothetical protein [Propionibacterium cyclohexanicum]